jgi:sigma-B regulation protein RsbU (phosphoserine phosphatase)
MPSTRMKRVAYAGLILLALSPWNEVLGVAAFPLLAVSFGYYAYRLALLFRERLFWRVRNRILASFVFIGVVPIGVVAFIGLIVVWFLVGAMGTLFTERQFESTIDRLDHIALRVQLELDDRELAALSSETEQQAQAERHRATLEKGEAALSETVSRAVQSNQDLPNLTLSIFEQKDDGLFLACSSAPHPAVRELPEWAPERHFAGLVLDDSTGYFRAISDIRAGGRHFYVLVSTPLSQDYAHAFWKRSGVYLYPTVSRRLHRDERGVHAEDLRVLKDPLTALDLIGSQEARRADPSLGVGAILLPWGSIFRATRWGGGPEAGGPVLDVGVRGVFRSTRWEEGARGARSTPLRIGMSIDPIRIFRNSLSSGYDLADPLLSVLIVLCGTLAAVELVSLIIGVVISRRITSAVHDLSLGTQAIRSGRLDFRVPARHRDQLGELANSFNAMAASIQALLVEVGDKQRMEAELQTARDVQAEFFPRVIPRIGRLLLAGTCVPARVVSGDCYDFLPHEDRLLDIVVGDISGKGLSAALLTASLQSALRLHAMVGDVEVRPGRLARMVGHLNRHLCLNTAPEKFATLFIGSYDPQASTLSYCCAGHNPPYLLQNGKMSQLSVGGCPVGLIADVRYEEAVVTLDAGDLFVIYTDGITEARSLSGEMFGEERLERVILDCSGLSCEEVQSQILETVREFSLGVEQADDQTLVVGKIV